MKLRYVACVALAAVCFGCVTKDQYDIRPEEGGDGIPTAVEWQNANNDRLAEVTKIENLKALVSTQAAADALLGQLKGAYTTDPMVMIQIGCATQIALCRKWDKAPEARKIWIAALKRKMAATSDDYIKTFCQQQLWLCE